MLVAMDIPAAAAGPWIVLGVVAGILLIGLAGLVAVVTLRRPPAPEPAPAPPAPTEADFPDDDLPGFLDSPPGSGTEMFTPAAGWPALSAPPHADAPPDPPASDIRGTGRETTRILTVMAVTALVLVGVAAAVAAAAQPPRPADPPSAGAPTREHVPLPSVPTAPSPGQPGAGALATYALLPGPGGVTADLTFGGVVLERRPVGVTVAYPRIRLTAIGEDREVLARVELPTWNCLADEAPEDPAAAGCTRSVPEHAELASPDLEIDRDGEDADAELRISGRFPTYLRPNGSPPVWTGRGYELLITVEPAGQPDAEGWMRAEGSLRLGEDEATTGASGVSVLRYGD